MLRGKWRPREPGNANAVEGFVKGGVVKVDQAENGVVAGSAIWPVVVIDHGRAQAVQENQEVWEDLVKSRGEKAS